MGSICDSSKNSQKENFSIDKRRIPLEDDNDINDTSIQYLPDPIEEKTNISEYELENKNNINNKKPRINVYDPKNLESIKYEPNLFKSNQSNFSEISQVEILCKGQKINNCSIIEENSLDNNTSRKLNDEEDTNNNKLFSKSVTGFSFSKNNKIKPIPKIEIDPLKPKSVALSSQNIKRNIMNINNDSGINISKDDRDSFNDSG